MRSNNRPINDQPRGCPCACVLLLWRSHLRTFALKTNDAIPRRAGSIAPSNATGAINERLMELTESQRRIWGVRVRDVGAVRRCADCSPTPNRSARTVDGSLHSRGFGVLLVALQRSHSRRSIWILQFFITLSSRPRGGGQGDSSAYMPETCGWRESGMECTRVSREGQKQRGTQWRQWLPRNTITALR